ncbi:hypothetical protein J2T32_001593 [Kerstersia gyiorum]|nr:hypothetical protein [Kerstersia gyiorum]MCP1670853.1 hypothetical protein [Kerstersia gyiorum]MCP1678493.1 hypothetical protein [Kerstersia gyiorum]MCP1682290.1 hypothetical protein [Kerstersia gyiorum]MCP1708805.1 hypothetical protein [Kerstersia gyiorum]
MLPIFRTPATRDLWDMRNTGLPWTVGSRGSWHDAGSLSVSLAD